MRSRLIVGVTVMVFTIIAMVWIYVDKNQNNMTVNSISTIPFGEETICTDSKEPK